MVHGTSEALFSSAASLRLDAARLMLARQLIEAWTQTGEVLASSFIVGRRCGMLETVCAGRRGPGPDALALGVEALFLAASLTKPVTAVATMMLVERGLLSLDDRIVEHIPEFAECGKEGVQVRHLLTHTSGLPDQLPENERLRASHSPLSSFVAGICITPLLFQPGTAIRYQSCGFAILGEMISRLTGLSLQEFLRTEIFLPLGMTNTSLGVDSSRCDRQVAVQIETESAATDYHWNTPYWRGLGAPWGGLITSPSDYGRFLRMMLGEGALDGVRILSPASTRAMVSDQVATFPAIPAEDRAMRPWGLGWRLHWPRSSAYFGDLLGPKSFGHWGATGTVVWADPELDAFAVILTSRPPGDRGMHLSRLSNVLASAFEREGS
jgi:CubicO group peptidase (beta-lactamase class C family)